MSVKKTAHDISIAAILATFVLMPTLIWAIVHAAHLRTVHDFIRYPIYIAIPFSFAMLLLFLFETFNWGPKIPTKKDAFEALFTQFAVLLVSEVIYAIYVCLRDILAWAESPNAPQALTVIVTVGLTGVLGLALFYFRLRLRAVYGFTEALVGLAAAGRQVMVIAGTPTITGTPAKDPTFYLAVLTAGVYLVVRGLDNIHQGISKEPRDPIVTNLIDELRAVETAEQEPRLSQ